MMRRNQAFSLHPDRHGDVIPVLAAAILVAAIAIQAKLLPPKPMSVEFPPRADETASQAALPEYAVPPDASAERTIVQTVVLPTEAVPDDQAASIPQPSVAMTASGGAAPFGAAEGAPPLAAGRAPLGIGVPMGAGNLRIRTSRSAALSSLATNLMRQIERLHPAQPHVAAKRPASVKAERLALNPAPGALAKPGIAGPAHSGVGGPAPVTGVLGGPSPLATRYSPIIDGTTLRRRF